LGLSDKDSETLQKAQNLSEKDPRVQISVSEGHRDRARILHSILKRARSERIVIGSVDLSVPLGDLLKLVQNLTDQENPVEAVFGDRTRKKDSPFLGTNTPKNRFEIMWMNILYETKKSFLRDPFCSAVAIKKSSLSPHLDELKPAGWYLTMDLFELCRKKGLKTAEVTVFASSGQTEHHSRFRENLLMLRRIFLRS
ncbi:MAG: hypothetical protein N2578_08450, partial [Bdellovibrionaceae bacterium]|nr:hypothetical protein [Pseudobdellovibrionaceae bacterium]